MRGELASGRDQQELELLDELMIGSGPNCDVVIRSEDTAPRHARLFSMEGAVYVEALDTSGETQINGEKLQKTRGLRSGDEITAGSAVIRLKF